MADQFVWRSKDSNSLFASVAAWPPATAAPTALAAPALPAPPMAAASWRPAPGPAGGRPVRMPMPAPTATTAPPCAESAPPDGIAMASIASRFSGRNRLSSPLVKRTNQLPLCVSKSTATPSWPFKELAPCIPATRTGWPGLRLPLGHAAVDDEDVPNSTPAACAPSSAAAGRRFATPRGLAAQVPVSSTAAPLGPPGALSARGRTEGSGTASLASEKP
mmetsp:Transcript_67909/g.196594  ORF Transcript_67909/g.196594 Transcript_67909/m.196594 type:complete len:219 (+) Transcript_67909:3355-4011(+)